MESKFKINFLLRNFLTNKIKNFFNKGLITKKNLFFLSNSALIFFYLKNSTKILYSESEKKSEIPLEQKVSVVEYNANTPIEDRYNVVKLKNIEGNLLAVFDGHGGDLVSEYASKAIAPYLDNIYLELTKNKKNKDKTQDQLITQALYDTFQKIVN